MGLQSLGSELFLFVLGMGVTLLNPHTLGKTPCCHSIKHQILPFYVDLQTRPTAFVIVKLAKK